MCGSEQYRLVATGWEFELLQDAAAAIEAQAAQIEALRDALAVAVRQNDHDMLMTGEELRACRAALMTGLQTMGAAAKGNGGRCGYCDDTGDVHSPDGQWRGSCSCPAGAAAKGQG